MVDIQYLEIKISDAVEVYEPWRHQFSSGFNYLIRLWAGWVTGEADKLDGITVINNNSVL